MSKYTFSRAAVAQLSFAELTFCLLRYINACAIVFSMFSVPELPYNDYFEYYGPDFKLNISPSNMTNQNTPEYLEKIK